jgi:hypothetical protein
MTPPVVRLFALGVVLALLAAAVVGIYTVVLRLRGREVPPRCSAGSPPSAPQFLAPVREHVAVMPNVASLSLMFVAAGLLLLAGVSLGRTRGRQPSRTTRALMAGMTGVALGFLLLIMFVAPLILFPIVIAGILVADWLVRRAWLVLGSFLVGAGGLWTAMQGLALINGLADEAVSYPGWTPIPLAVSAAVTLLGAGLVLATTLRGSRPRPR